MLAPLTAACVAAAASAFGVAEPMLWTILRAEGGKVGACTPQTNGTQDCGPAQVNAETWVPHLSRVLARPPAEVLADLRDDGCFNIHAGAYVLRLKIGEAGGDRWDGAGRYNSATPEYKRAYQLRLVKSYADLFLRAGPRPAPQAGAFALVEAPPAARTPVQARTRLPTPPQRPSEASPQAPAEPAAAPAPVPASPPAAPTAMAQAALPVPAARPMPFDPLAVPMPSVPPGARPPTLGPAVPDRGTAVAEARPQLHAAR